ncbi:MAG: adenylate/guanylate cyclase domain-containing protein [Pseudomonadota bacterium]
MATTESRERQLAVILHADIVGSTELVRRDESLAHRRITDAFYRFTEAIAAYHGVVHEVRGDALVAEFSRASDAISAALAFQQSNTTLDTEEVDDIAPVLRVGISLGEVIIGDNTITGPGIVLAQRVEQLAQDGGVCATAAVYEAAPGRFPFDYKDLGPQLAKGFDEPVNVYAVTLRSDAVVPLPEPIKARVPNAARYAWTNPAAFLIGAGMLTIAAWFLWQHTWAPKIEPARQEYLAYPIPDRPSIAVLPLTNVSKDDDETYFADGVTADIITDLSKVSGLFVIARKSSFAYRNNDATVARVAEALGVRYVLTGDIRRSNNQIRVNAELIDAMNGESVWADRYNGVADDIFALQDRISNAVVKELAINLLPDESDAISGRDTDLPVAYDSFLVGWAHHQVKSVESLAKAKTSFENAVALDPTYAKAWAALVELYYQASSRGYREHLGIDMDDVPRMLKQAVTRPSPLAAEAQLHRLASLMKYADMATLIEKTITRYPSYPYTYGWRGILAAREGRVHASLRDFATALRLDPRNALTLAWYAKVLLQANRDAEALDHIERANVLNPDDLTFLPVLVASYALVGRSEDAKRVAARLIKARKQTGYAATFVGSWDGDIMSHPSYRKRIHRGLELAGMPTTVRPEDLDLPADTQLTGEQLRTIQKSGYRTVGNIPEGQWTIDTFPDGARIHYWRGREVGRSDYWIEGNESVYKYRPPSNLGERRCKVYRNPNGSKANLDARISLCSHGVYTSAVFPLPTSAR